MAASGKGEELAVGWLRPRSLAEGAAALSFPGSLEPDVGVEIMSAGSLRPSAAAKSIFAGRFEAPEACVEPLAEFESTRGDEPSAFSELTVAASSGLRAGRLPAGEWPLTVEASPAAMGASGTGEGLAVDWLWP